MKTKKQLQTIMASYFCYFADDIKEMLNYYSEANQRRITQMFLNIIEQELYVQNDKEGTFEITVAVAEDISIPVGLIVRFYFYDKMLEETMKDVKNYLFKTIKDN